MKISRLTTQPTAPHPYPLVSCPAHACLQGGVWGRDYPRPTSTQEQFCKPDLFRPAAPIAFSIGTRSADRFQYWHSQQRSVQRDGKGLTCETNLRPKALPAWPAGTRASAVMLSLSPNSFRASIRYKRALHAWRIINALCQSWQVLVEMPPTEPEMPAPPRWT